ncbi:MAG: hypothetical protein WC527_08585 [Candidatus Margulisiibacteriota bacterium]
MRVQSYIRFDKTRSPQISIRMPAANMAIMGQIFRDLSGRPAEEIKHALETNFRPQPTDVNLELTTGQFDMLASHISTGKFVAPPVFLRNHEKETDILAFSFGAGLPVNIAIARNIMQICAGKGCSGSPVNIYAQWEILDQLRLMGTGNDGSAKLHRIEIPATVAIGPNVKPENLDDLKSFLLEKGIIPDLTTTTTNEAMIGHINECIRTSSFYDLLVKRNEAQLVSALESCPGPVREAINYMRLKTSGLRETRFQDLQAEQREKIKQLNLAILMALIPEKYINFYITSKGILDAYSSSPDKQDKVFLAGQSWHGPRLIGLCRKAGLNVTGGAFVDVFSPRDTQSWVRDPFSWEIKESSSMMGDNTDLMQLLDEIK